MLIPEYPRPDTALCGIVHGQRDASQGDAQLFGEFASQSGFCGLTELDSTADRAVEDLALHRIRPVQDKNVLFADR